ncbi:DUF262 domain-containing protein [Zhongshania sp.]|uniref:DUF262 domain-containing protein n=1 Tax=Zhongshania sp. TaxID=1971902 RepID=UPI001B71FAF0|nr:DUF262 domain-containing protein [Zhongshania sp.]MBQ0797632.1 DUF262 domain-containing protein [Zhongshania sp.]
MGQSNNVCSVKEYFQKGTFIIPNYQRGYKWGVPSKTKENKEGTEAIGVLMQSLFSAFRQSKHEYFLQGITVVEKENKEIVLIDGQQRTTTLFILLAYINSKIGGLSEYINRKDEIAIRYDIRKTSHEYLKELASPEYEIVTPDSKSDAQDIFYFKKAINTIQREWANFYTKTTYRFSELIKEEPVGNSLYHGALSKFECSANDEDKLLVAFKEYLLENVKMLYIPIHANKATTIFKMMNGQKAEMKVEELIKSAILSQSSRVNKVIETNGNDINTLLQVVKEKVGEEWEINALRSKYAREWDRWLYWWNKKDVADYFGTNREPMGLLLEYFYYMNANKTEYSKDKKKIGQTFDAFKTAFLTCPKDAKNNFGRIRKLQKTFEDWYYTPKIYNQLGLILRCGGNKKEALSHLIKIALKGESIQEELSRLANYMLVEATPKQIIEDSTEIKDRAIEVYTILNEADVYNERNAEGVKDNRKEMAFRQLLRMNMEMDSALDRKFDFSIWNTRSLEHVHPKSKVYRLIEGETRRCTDNEICKPENGSFINKADFPEWYSEHCIGNLFLLSGKDNSAFGAKDFNEKKQLLFSAVVANEEKGNIKESIKLLHTASAFAQSEWNSDIIREKKDEFLQAFTKTYSLTQN